jgi:MoaA/NifB/PqqE/SkfB family radical SAM enzyme
MGIDQSSFLPADVSSHAFNREVLWSDQRQQEILPQENELPELNTILESIIEKETTGRFIAEDPGKLRKIYLYYAAFYGKNSFPFKKCNAPWVSVVIESDGMVRPCFFHPSIGNIREQPLEKILNEEKAIAFRKQLDTVNDSICKKCVCYLHLSPGVKLN